MKYHYNSDCIKDTSITSPSNPQGPFTYEFMVPEERDSYGSGTTFIRIPKNPTLEEKEFIIEPVISLFVRFDPESKESYLLERRIWSD